MVQRHLTIRDLALVIRYVAKSIIQLRKQIRRSACHNIFYRILAGRRAGLSEVANDLGLMVLVFRVERGTKGDQCASEPVTIVDAECQTNILFSAKFINSLSPRQ